MRDNIFITRNGGSEVYAGDGDDEIIVLSGSQQYFDGYIGRDTINYSTEDPIVFRGGLDIKILDDSEVSPDFYAIVGNRRNELREDIVVGVEVIVASFDDDIVRLAGSLDPQGLSIDAAGEAVGGDTLDLGELTTSSGVSLNLASPVVQLNFDGKSIEIIDFENFIGSGLGDSFKTSDTQVGEVLIAGGEGDDNVEIPWASQSSNKGPVVFFGGAGADTVTFSLDYAYAQSLLNPNPSPSLIRPWGEGNVQAMGILVVDVPDLTADNFDKFSVDDLGFTEGFDWSEIDVVLINPDSNDRIYQERVGRDGTSIETRQLGITGTNEHTDPYFAPPSPLPALDAVDDGWDEAGYGRGPPAVLCLGSKVKAVSAPVARLSSVD